MSVHGNIIPLHWPPRPELPEPDSGRADRVTTRGLPVCTRHAQQNGWLTTPLLITGQPRFCSVHED